MIFYLFFFLWHSGRWQLQEAIAACHTAAPSWGETDWLQIVTLYDLLLARDPSPVPRLNRAVAVAELGEPERALADLDDVADALSGFHLFHATHVATAVSSLLGNQPQRASGRRERERHRLTRDRAADGCNGMPIEVVPGQPQSAWMGARPRDVHLGVNHAGPPMPAHRA